MEGLISVLIPCRNEEAHIEACLGSVCAFKLPCSTEVEILVLDGQSTDRTRELVAIVASRDDRIRLLENPNLSQAHALNLGIRASRGAWIMRLDAHTEYADDYLFNCYTTAVRTGAANVGGICITMPGSPSYQAGVVQALTTHKFGVGNSGFRVGAEEGKADTVPFGFFRRRIFEEIGYIDERLLRGQDYEFNCRIRASGAVVWLNPAIKSYYYNQRNLFSFYRKQVLLEAPFNAYMWYVAPYAFAARHAITAVFAMGVIMGSILSTFSAFIAWPLYTIMGLYALLATISGIQQAIRYRRVRHVFFLPPCFFLYHFVHGVGVWLGVVRLLCGHAPVQQRQEPWPGAGRFRAWPLTAGSS